MKIFILFIISFFLFIRADGIDYNLNKSQPKIDSTAIIIVDTVILEGHLVYYYEHKTNKSYYSKTCFFVFLDSNNLVNEPDSIKKVHGYNYMDKGQLSALARDYKLYERRNYDSIFTFKKGFPQLANSFNLQPITFIKDIYIKNRKGSHDLKIYKLKKGECLRIDISNELLKNVFPSYEVPESLISEKGWVRIIVPL